MLRSIGWPYAVSTLLFAMGCGQQAGGPDVVGGDSSGMDAVDVQPEVAVAYQHGTLIVAQVTGAVLSLANESASFLNVPPGGTTTITDEMQGACRVIHAVNTMPDAGAGGAVSGGAITFAGGTGNAVTLNPMADGSYMAATQFSTRWAGGDVITVSASGSAVPAFQTMVTFPPRITVTSPAVAPVGGTLTITRANGLPIQWMATGSGTAAVEIVQNAGGTATQILCSYPFAEGADMVPASVLTVLSPGQAQVIIGSLAADTFSSGSYQIDVYAAAANIIVTAAMVQ